MAIDHAAKLETIFQDLMTEETVPARKRTKLNCAHWDSLMQLGLISAIEQEFGVSISDEDAIDLNSFDSALQIVSEKLTAQKS